MRGEYVEKDYQKAFEYYTKSAEKGNALAQQRLGDMYKSGRYYVRQDNKKAYMWYTRSAENGNVNAQKELADMYKNDQNYKQAYMWYYLAKLSGEDTDKKLEELTDTGWFHLSTPKVSEQDAASAKSEAQRKFTFISKN